ncbi:MAG TPA: vanadium-dependent haloperoxidase [Burkholderiales bacterium]|nr:vanadium-dependent haloperoxidase [Burkholderiales bacterium]
MKSVSKVLTTALLAGMVAAPLSAARADVITDWNVITSGLVANDVGNNPRLRTLAMVHVAMSDAVNTVQNRYARVVATLPAAPGASADAAAAAAARHILTQIYPEQKAKIEEAYAASLKAIPEGPAKIDGIKLGVEVADAVLADRANDGTNAADTYRPHAAPGVYVPTTTPLWDQYARAKPWVFKSAEQFRPGPPPALASAEWARDYNEVKNVGGTKSTARTPEQSEAVKFWGNVNFGGAWQGVARELAMKQKMPLADCARLFALLNMGLANAYIVNWDAKYAYNFWRPVTAIRNGDQDGNDATERDAGWTSFNPTPMHPEYPSQATINAVIASVVLESVFGPVKAISFTATDVRDAKRTRQFASLADMAEEQKNVRVWGGVHYRFAIRTSEDMGRKVAAYMIENTLQPAR